MNGEQVVNKILSSDSLTITYDTEGYFSKVGVTISDKETPHHIRVYTNFEGNKIILVTFFSSVAIHPKFLKESDYPQIYERLIGVLDLHKLC